MQRGKRPKRRPSCETRGGKEEEEWAGGAEGGNVYLSATLHSQRALVVVLKVTEKLVFFSLSFCWRVLLTKYRTVVKLESIVKQKNALC